MELQTKIIIDGVQQPITLVAIADQPNCYKVQQQDVIIFSLRMHATAQEPAVLILDQIAINPPFTTVRSAKNYFSNMAQILLEIVARHTQQLAANNGAQIIISLAQQQILPYLQADFKILALEDNYDPYAALLGNKPNYANFRALWQRYLDNHDDDLYTQLTSPAYAKFFATILHKFPPEGPKIHLTAVQTKLDWQKREYFWASKTTYLQTIQGADQNLPFSLQGDVTLYLTPQHLTMLAARYAAAVEASIPNVAAIPDIPSVIAADNAANAVLPAISPQAAAPDQLANAAEPAGIAPVSDAVAAANAIPQPAIAQVNAALAPPVIAAAQAAVGAANAAPDLEQLCAALIPRLEQVIQAATTKITQTMEQRLEQLTRSVTAVEDQCKTLQSAFTEFKSKQALLQQQQEAKQKTTATRPELNAKTTKGKDQSEDLAALLKKVEHMRLLQAVGSMQGGRLSN